MSANKGIMQKSNSKPDIQLWISDLGSSDESVRRKARLLVIRESQTALPALLQTLSSGNGHARWEAAEALVVIRSPSAAVALVNALEDEEHDIRWAAMKALIALKRDGLEPLLKALMQDFASVRLREGAHHILSVLQKQRQLRQPSLQVLRALEGIEPESSVAWAAEEAWESLFGPGIK